VEQHERIVREGELTAIANDYGRQPA